MRNIDMAIEPEEGGQLAHGRYLNFWLQSRSLPARVRVGLEVHRCLCIINAGNVFISTVMGRICIAIYFA
jgi:hypothetical protein